MRSSHLRAVGINVLSSSDEIDKQEEPGLLWKTFSRHWGGSLIFLVLMLSWQMRAIHEASLTSADGLCVQDWPWALGSIVCKSEPLNWTAGAAALVPLSSVQVWLPSLCVLHKPQEPLVRSR